jgi:hypothetical protein
MTTPSAALRKSLLFIVILGEKWFGDEALLSFDSLALPSGRNWKVRYYTPINRFGVKPENAGRGEEYTVMGKW